ncbi:MAG: winged helix DNA-binding domain-containing protein [Streptosporangiales bacterium]|nr:winged helix DNA-binding domain-containing protein [Streptosporangiales bacterium]
MRVIDRSERRARLGLRHRLAPGRAGTTAADAATAVLALHATDPASVYLSAAARLDGATVASIEHALYDERSVVRMLGMRRTVFVVPAPLVPVVQAACTRTVARRERTKLLTFVTQSGFTTRPERWLAGVERATVEALAARGEATAAALSSDVPELARRIVVGQGRWQGEVNASTRVLFLLAADGRIVRGRPRGSWLSTQYHWAPAESWLPGGIPDLATDTAQAELARQWLHAYGPAPADDLKWWAGWTVAETKRALAAAGTVEVESADGTGHLLADDLEPVDAPDPWIALLPALDPTGMGWTRRDWFLGPHRAALFDRAGNIGPTIWCDGRIVGGWAHRADGVVATRLLEDVGTEAGTAVEAAAARLADWMGDVRPTPRFRTPLERELAGHHS